MTRTSPRFLVLQIALATSITLLPSPPSHAAGGRGILGGSGIDLRIRMAVDPVDPPPEYDPCGTATSLVAYTGERVRWCYRVTNNTGTTLTRHDLETTEFGVVLDDFPFSIAPGASPFITRVGDATTTLVEEAIWTAYNPGPSDVHTATAAARVVVRPGISVEATLGLDPVGPPPSDYCGTAHVLNVPEGRTVRWCFRLTNHSSIARTRHTLQTALNGTVIEDFPFTVQPGDDPWITVTQTVGSTSLEQSGTWTAFRPGPDYVSVATSNIARALVGPQLFLDGFE